VAATFGGGLHGGKASVTVSDVLGYLLQPLDIVWVAPFVLTCELESGLGIDVVVVVFVRVDEVCKCMH
jgi:hypothetical protein